jgi:diguanylate cyclase (GGDEF)-like protein
VVDVLSQTLRAEDVLARYGGEEFAVLARGIALPNAKQMGERLRKRVETMQMECEGEPLRLSISIGVSIFPLNDEPVTCFEKAAEQLIARADAALYVAKNRGRNRVED